MMHRLRRYDVMLRIMMLPLCRNDAMFACKNQRSDIISAGNIIGEANIICRKANIIQKKPDLSGRQIRLFVGDPERTRTVDLQRDRLAC